MIEPSAVRRLLAAGYGASAGLAGIAAAFVVGTLWVLPFAPVPRGRRERYTMRGAVLFSRVVLDGILLVDQRVTGTLDLRDDEGAVIVSNHRSWLDPMLLMRHTRSNGLSKHEIFWLPFIGLYGWLAGAVFFDRRDPRDRHRARDEVMRLVRAGHRLQVFPEGTRSRTGALSERVYLNLPMDCWRAGVPVACCAVVGTERVLPPGRFAAWPRQTVELRIGRTLRPSDHPDAHRFATACWAEVQRLVAQPDPAGAGGG
ncbi:MAG: lysophospholipid acyltransferase family protein [Myxococcota bacterium]